MPDYPKIGAHISAAVNISQAPRRAWKAGCECFQFFSRSPQGGPTKELTEQTVADFKADCEKYKLESYLHSPYYINLASAKNNIYYGSISALREELERGSLLGVKYMMAHLGSAKDLGKKAGMKRVAEGLEKVLAGYKGKTEFLIELSAGAGAIIGDTFEEIAKIVNSPRLRKHQIGICFDTCHAFASGYDLRTEQAVKKTFKKFDQILGLKRLKLIHANDSQTGLGSHKDRHEHIGQGQIGLAGFRAIVKFAEKQKINLILETPDGNDRVKDIKMLKKIKKQAK
ncbi:MAG: deoxyribonuclease IV [Patescibacteria group bacterium]|jgi:deoxyribonuclease-4